MVSLNTEHVNKLLVMISKAHTTSVLNQLEYHRQNLHESEFRNLLLSLTTELNTVNWTQSINNQEIQLDKRKRLKVYNQWERPSKKQIDHCCCIVFYYIVSVINKYQIFSVENLWNEILGNSLTKNKQFYHYLHKNKIRIPNETCKLFSGKLKYFYILQSEIDQMKLIELGFICHEMITVQTSIKKLEKIFSQLKQREKSYDKIIEPESFISLMNTPEKLSLFLSYFPDYNINQVDKTTGFNVLESLINMKPYFYSPPIDMNNQIQLNFRQSHQFTYKTLKPLPTSKFNSHPNEIIKYRAVRIVSLVQQLICRGARFSTPIYSNISFRQIAANCFFITSIGIYVFIGLYMNNLYLNTSTSQYNNYFILFIIHNVQRFEPEFQDFILYYLSLSYSIVHKPEFMIAQRRIENEEQQQINDKLFQRSIKLKEWCRLKIKDNCSQENIKKLNLSKSLINYCSFNLFNSNYPLQCITEVVKHKGNAQPNRTYRRFPSDTLADLESDEQMEIDANSNSNESYNSTISSNDNDA